jgi:hypothetical protein
VVLVGVECVSVPAFNRLLQIPGASVTDVVIGDRDIEVVLRAGLIAPQGLGMALCCFVLRLPSVVAMSSEELIECLGRTLQRYALG